MPKHPFPKTSRLREPGEFRRVFSCKERPLFTPLVVVHTRRTEATGARIGIVCSKKKVRRAVDRNRLKRLARETFRHVCSALPKCDIVLVFLKRATTAENAEITQCLNQQFNRLKKPFGK